MLEAKFGDDHLRAEIIRSSLSSYRFYTEY